jgi:hypothetical protein
MPEHRPESDPAEDVAVVEASPGDSVDRLHDAHGRAVEAHAGAKAAFDRLEEAHHRGDPGIAEHGEFGRRLEEVRSAAAEVRKHAGDIRHQAQEQRRQVAKRPAARRSPPSPD